MITQYFKESIAYIVKNSIEWRKERKDRKRTREKRRRGNKG